MPRALAGVRIRAPLFRKGFGCRTGLSPASIVYLQAPGQGPGAGLPQGAPPNPGQGPQEGAPAPDPASACSHYRGEACVPEFALMMLNRSEHLYFDGLGCTFSTSCPIWRNGTYDLSKFPERIFPFPFHSSKPCADVTKNGSFVPYDHLHGPVRGGPHYMFGSNASTVAIGGNKTARWMRWQPAAKGCSLHVFNPRDMYACLAGKRLVISGNSLNRHLFTNIYFSLRGIHKPMGKTHGNGYFRMDGKRDELEFEMQLSEIGSESYHMAGTMEVIYAEGAGYEEVLALKPDIYMTWDFTGSQTTAEGLRDHAEKIMSHPNAPAQFLYIPFPPTDCCHGNGITSAQVSAMYPKLVDLYLELSAKYPGRIYLMPSYDMHLQNPWPLYDSIHYQCNILPDVREFAQHSESSRAGERERVQRYSDGSTDQCWDSFNTAMIQHMLNIVCLG
eukprot:gene14974-21030_t